MSHDLSPGTLIDGRYRIVRHLGAGGFADVFEAVHVQIERPVALKVLQIPAHLIGDVTFEERFRQEAAIAARIDHPGVVRIYDFGVHIDAQAPYIAMELLHGEDLGELIEREGGMAAERALPLFVQALDALGKAHALNIVHKDLKPSNLFVVRPGTDDEALRLVDFGIARLLDERDGQKLTQTGQMVGTPQYLAPEYINTTTALPATDVYQMGLILVELLTGQVAVQGNNSLHCLIIHSSGDISIPDALLDSPLGPIVQRATALDPNARYQDAAAFATALRAIDPATLPAFGASAPSTAPLAFEDTDTFETNEADTVPPNAWSAAPSTPPTPTPPTPTPAPGPAPAVNAPPEPTPSPTPPPAAKTVHEPSPIPPPPPTPAPRSNRLPLIITAVSVIAALLLGFAWVTGIGGSAPADPPTSAAAPSAQAPAPNTTAPSPPQTPPDLDPTAATTPEAAPPNADQVRLRITSAPSGAGVFAGDIKLGMTPWTWERAKDDLPVTLSVRLEGYDDTSLTLVPNADRDYHSALTKTEAATPDPTAAKPTAKPVATTARTRKKTTPKTPAHAAANTTAPAEPKTPAAPNTTPPAAQPTATTPSADTTAKTTRGRRMGKMN